MTWDSNTNKATLWMPEALFNQEYNWNPQALVQQNQLYFSMRLCILCLAVLSMCLIHTILPTPSLFDAMTDAMSDTLTRSDT